MLTVRDLGRRLSTFLLVAKRHVQLMHNKNTTLLFAFVDVFKSATSCNIRLKPLEMFLSNYPQSG